MFVRHLSGKSIQAIPFYDPLHFPLAKSVDSIENSLGRRIPDTEFSRPIAAADQLAIVVE
jgi:hypothetical protein